ncbi:MAG: MBL fold metallo-hydrolase [Oscillospiraceae bacterium]|nr:MBL fold metallo-hydrolase [Oscillospiraceae bacterium]
MIEEIIQNIYRISIPLPHNPLKELNAYAVKGPDRSLVIDTGFRLPECRTALEEGLRAAGIDRNRMDIALTHLHSDHTGLAPDLIPADGRVYISAIDRKWLEGASRADDWESSDLRYLAEGFPRPLLEELWEANPARVLAPAEYSHYVSLHPGDVLTVGDYSLTCVSTPGHTPGHMCFWIEERGVMFLGDHVLFDITPNITAWNGVEDSLGDYLRSLEEIRCYPIQIPLPGHRGVIGDVAARTRALAAHHTARLNETLDVVRTNPGLTAYEIAGRMTWRIRARNWDEFPVAQKWFAVGEAMAHLDYLTRRGQVERRVSGEVGIYFAI